MDPKSRFRILLTILISMCPYLHSMGQRYPYSTNTNSLTIWNGSEYVPFFVKGINLGVAVPGTFPGEMAATRQDYSRWFAQIKEAGFNCIRLYTLHYPRFYQALDSFNRLNPKNPLLFIQGVWLNEESTNSTGDLYALADTFKVEIRENLNAVHGRLTVAERRGKAFGVYDSDVSAWCLAYLIGREVFPDEVLITNRLHGNIHSFSGSHFSISNASPTETWLTEMLDFTADYEEFSYGTQRPVSFSSWPTLDPIRHLDDPNRMEDTVGVDLSGIHFENVPAGLFISYHAYPYYPDFVSSQSDYMQASDDFGTNSYLGYLKDLRQHYPKLPLIIAEYGVPSSWAIAHYATSGMNHGGFDEYRQGTTNVRLLENILESGCGGGIQFSWLDEWFKRTWIMDPVDYLPDSRTLWQNLGSAEQNFGLVSIRSTFGKDTLLAVNPQSSLSYLTGEANSSFLELEIGLQKSLGLLDRLWVSLDTYGAELGESFLSDVGKLPNRAEFALKITNYDAQLYVTQAYDLFGIWHHDSRPEQKYRSISSDGAPWNIVRLRNNTDVSDVQYIGNLKVNHSFQPYSSMDAVTIYPDKIQIRLPWSYVNFVAPNQMLVMNDDRATLATEDTISDGIGVSVWSQNQWLTGTHRFKWPSWHSISRDSSTEKLKASYYVMKEELPRFNTPAVAFRDSFSMPYDVKKLVVDQNNGLLKNDYDLDGNALYTLIAENPKHGTWSLDQNGSFSYWPEPHYSGIDTMRYYVYDGYSLSKSNMALIHVAGTTVVESTNNQQLRLRLSPNPGNGLVQVWSDLPMDRLQVFDFTGRLIQTTYLSGLSNTMLETNDWSPGKYILVAGTSKGLLSAVFLRK